MKKAAVYSRSGRASGRAGLPVAAPAGEAQPPAVSWRKRHARRLKIAAGVLGGLLAVAVLWMLLPSGGMTPQQVEAVVQRVLDSQQPAPTAADAYESILPSVVHVRGLPDAPDADVASGGEVQSGTGVVIVDTGVILTNLHVVNGAKAIKIVFHDGLESDAIVTGVQPEHDLAVLQAKTIPDDLEAATLRSTQGLRPGEPVVAIGFPFGIGPSVSAGVISGLGREYQNADGKRILTNLIQFDAAVNPGNSGGPLVTLEGEVIGIVTGLLNPTEQRVFIGIGFAVPIENAAGAVGLSPF
ncbi:MAG TPA: trypsin-like peptidase domain-containing protein [Burkholderiales bacterium]|nr:trypsin-like peptidase domain-containing protein [Burkholderiales bacterium]